MDMAMRSFVFAGAVLAVLAAGLAGWWLFDRFAPGDEETPGDGGRITINDPFDDREGSVYDEFGQSGSRDDQIVITPGRSLVDDDVFDTGRSRDRAGSTRFGDGPRFDWSGSGGSLRGGRSSAPLPRDTAAERVEADCRIRGGGSYACRCLVRLARRDLSEAEFEFLSLADEPESRPERLGRAGLEMAALGALSGRLIALDVEAKRRCGAGLTP